MGHFHRPGIRRDDARRMPMWNGNVMLSLLVIINSVNDDFTSGIGNNKRRRVAPSSSYV